MLLGKHHGEIARFLVPHCFFRHRLGSRLALGNYDMTEWRRGFFTQKSRVMAAHSVVKLVEAVTLLGIVQWIKALIAWRVEPDQASKIGRGSLCARPDYPR